MANVFISYARADSAQASTVARKLTQYGISVFYDVDLVSGDHWDRRIEMELANAAAVIVLWSATSCQRQWVRNEARVGMQRGILCPALIEECDIPIEFGHIQAADLRTFFRNNVQSEFDKLRSAADRLIQQHQITTVRTSDFSNQRFDADQAKRTHRRYNESLLHPRLAEIVGGARLVEITSLAVQNQSEVVANEAAKAASRAQRGEIGYGALREMDGADEWIYEGALSATREKLGLGTMSARAGKSLGMSIAGSWEDDNFAGLTVISSVIPYSQHDDMMSYWGQCAEGALEGLGVSRGLTGWMFFGSHKRDSRDGLGVMIYADERRYEGEWKSNRRHGLGALWSPSGQPISAGIWETDTLVEPLDCTAP